MRTLPLRPQLLLVSRDHPGTMSGSASSTAGCCPPSAPVSAFTLIQNVFLYVSLLHCWFFVDTVVPDRFLCPWCLAQDNKKAHPPCKWCLSSSVACCCCFQMPGFCPCLVKCDLPGTPSQPRQRLLLVLRPEAPGGGQHKPHALTLLRSELGRGHALASGSAVFT